MKHPLCKSLLYISSALVSIAGAARVEAALITLDIAFVAPLEQAWDDATKTLVPIARVAPPPLTEARGEFLVTYDPSTSGFNLTSVVVKSLNFDPGSQVVFNHLAASPGGSETLAIGGLAGYFFEFMGPPADGALNGPQQLAQQDFALWAFVRQNSVLNCCGSFFYRTPDQGPNQVSYETIQGHVSFVTVDASQPVPEPGGLALLGLGLLLLVAARRTRRALRLAAAELLDD